MGEDDGAVEVVSEVAEMGGVRALTGWSGIRWTTFKS